MKAIEEHEAALAETFRTALRDIPGVKLYVAPDGVRKTPTIAFTVQGQPTDEVCARMLEHGFFIAAGDFYASTLTEKLGIGDSGGFIRAGLAPYNTEEEVERFVEALENRTRNLRSRLRSRASSKFDAFQVQHRRAGLREGDLEGGASGVLDGHLAAFASRLRTLCHRTE